MNIIQVIHKLMLEEAFMRRSIFMLFTFFIITAAQANQNTKNWLGSGSYHDNDGKRHCSEVNFGIHQSEKGLRLSGRAICDSYIIDLGFRNLEIRDGKVYQFGKLVGIKKSEFEINVTDNTSSTNYRVQLRDGKLFLSVNFLDMDDYFYIYSELEQ